LSDRAGLGLTGDQQQMPARLDATRREFPEADNLWQRGVVTGEALKQILWSLKFDDGKSNFSRGGGTVVKTYDFKVEHGRIVA